MAVCNGEPVPWDEAKAMNIDAGPLFGHRDLPISLINPLPFSRIAGDYLGYG